MKNFHTKILIVTLVMLVYYFNACDHKASSGENGGALSNINDNDGSKMYDIWMKKGQVSESSKNYKSQARFRLSPTMPPEITTALKLGRQEISLKEEEVPKNLGADAELELKDVLGEFTTYYQSSSDARKKNIINAANKINGISILPGEIFSCAAVLQPITEENGFAVSFAYEDGKIIASVGGGVCQVSTTLYNAVLQAELEVVERHSHSMTVSYVELSRDAAIAGDYMDLKFKNNMDFPVVIEAVANNSNLTIRIIGEEERDLNNRIVEYQTVIVSETKPPSDVVTYDETQPNTYYKITQVAHTGYETELYKVTFQNGLQVNKIRINTSIYTASPQYITVGTISEETNR